MRLEAGNDVAVVNDAIGRHAKDQTGDCQGQEMDLGNGPLRDVVQKTSEAARRVEYELETAEVEIVRPEQRMPME